MNPYLTELQARERERPISDAPPTEHASHAWPKRIAGHVGAGLFSPASSWCRVGRSIEAE